MEPAKLKQPTLTLIQGGAPDRAKAADIMGYYAKRIASGELRGAYVNWHPSRPFIEISEQDPGEIGWCKCCGARVVIGETPVPEARCACGGECHGPQVRFRRVDLTTGRIWDPSNPEGDAHDNAQMYERVLEIARSHGKRS